MKVYLIVIFVILCSFLIYILSLENKAYNKPIIDSEPLTLSEITPDNIPNKEKGFTYYSTPFKAIDYNQALTIDVNFPIHVNIWSVSSYNSKWELTNTQCQGKIVNNGETVTVVLSPNELYVDELKAPKNKLSVIHPYGFIEYNPDEEYNFVLKVPDTAYVNAKSEFLTSSNIRLKVVSNSEPIKQCNMFSEKKVITEGAYNIALSNVFKPYGEVISNYGVREEPNPHSLDTVFTSERFTLGINERLCIYYVDHSSNRGCLYSRITLYSANDDEPIDTNVTGIHSTRSHTRNGLKSGIIDINNPGIYYLKEIIGPTRQRLNKVSSETLIPMIVNIVDPSKAQTSTHTIEI